mmetsp:Transcript_47443/g.98436  ORF Transcript_47443/g.98436 Transcript_47443/m.98436 type:complete len:130 (+) Transcript_47443:2463-2852(+)
MVKEKTKEAIATLRVAETDPKTAAQTIGSRSVVKYSRGTWITERTAEAGMATITEIETTARTAVATALAVTRKAAETTEETMGKVVDVAIVGRELGCDHDVDDRDNGIRTNQAGIGRFQVQCIYTYIYS